MSTLGNEVEFLGGSQPSKRQFISYKKAGYVRLIQVRDYKTDAYPTYIPIESARKFCAKEDIMIGRYGPPLFQILRGLEGAYNVALIKAVPNDRVLKNYLYYFLKKPGLVQLIESLSQRTSGLTGIDMKALKNYPFPLLPLTIQTKIAQILDKVNELRQKRWQANIKFNELAQSVFLDIFGDSVKNPKGWNSVPLTKLVYFISGGTPARKNPSFFNGHIPWITTASLHSTYISAEDALEYITEEAINNSATKEIPENSLLIGIRVGVGKLSINTCKICTNQDIAAFVIADKTSATNEYLWGALTHYNGYLTGQSRGATVKGITFDLLKKLNVPVPPIALQMKYASFVQRVEAQKSKNLEAAGQLDELFNSLLQRVFRD